VKNTICPMSEIKKKINKKKIKQERKYSKEKYTDKL
jgi:hypothetical protein